MATNNNGHLVDDKGNVVVDFVWGNFPLQPNDVRNVSPTNSGNTYPSALLDFSLDNHVIAETGWNGYPLYTPNTDGASIDANSDGKITANEIFIVVPTVIGQTTAVATNTLKDAGFGTVTVGSSASAINITRTNVTATTSANIYASAVDTLFPVGSSVIIQAGTSAGSVHLPTALRGTWTVTASGSGYVTISGTGWTVADTTSISDTGTLKGVTDTTKTQSTAANAASISAGATITITPWA